MSKTYTFKIVSVCDGGEHIRVRILEDGVVAGVRVIDRSNVLIDDTALTDIMENLFKRAIKNASATTAAARKTAIESIQVIL